MKQRRTAGDASTAAFLAALLFSGVPAAADAAAPAANEISFRLGKLSPSHASVSLLGPEEDAMSPGIGYGVRYLRKRSPNTSLGFDLDILHPEAKDSLTLVANGLMKTQVDSKAILAVAKFSSSGSGMKLYFLGGLGLHSTSVQIDGRPAPGFVWRDTGTDETRRFVDSRRSGLATKLEGGVDCAVSETGTVGLFAAINNIGSATYSRSRLGLSGMKEAFSVLVYGLSVGTRF